MAVFPEHFIYRNKEWARSHQWAMASQLPPEQSLTNEEGRLIANSGGKIFKSAHVTLKDGKRETKNRRDECQGSRFKRNNIDNYLK